MKNYKILVNILAGAFLLFVTTSCLNDLNTVPIDPNITTSANVFNDPAAFKEALAKVYATLAVTGQQGPNGQDDLGGADEGTAQYLRQLFVAQELCADEVICGWGDPGIAEANQLTWDATTYGPKLMYNRILYTISIANEYIRQVQPRTDGDPERLQFIAEARFIRALAYWHGIDLYGNIPFITENDPVGKFLPKQGTRLELFNYVVNELKEIGPVLAAPHANEYGRVDRAAAWALLARLYLNSEVYTKTSTTAGTSGWSECITYCDSIINAGYSLNPVYQNLFLADNDLNNPEVIFAVPYDGLSTQTHGGTSYLIRAEVVPTQNPADFGIDGGNKGLRARKTLVQKFDDPSGQTDTRAMFYTDGQKLENTQMGAYTDGYAVTKWKNITSHGVPGKNGNRTDTDWPLFRLADVYLMYAEAALRLNDDAKINKALDYVNLIRERAYANDPASGKIVKFDLTLNFIIDERARELYWEGYRRSDLIRFGLFTSGTYLWPWKGGALEGQGVADYYNLYPIPSTDIGANTNLVQNPGY
ncbi:MAG: RagB/SusD family nutrient uptake outer membrane protein [Prolixibacteraceae bacterium]|jgi:hypothetical protein